MKDQTKNKSKSNARHDMGAIYSELRSSLTRYASRYFKRPQDIEDVVQDAFVKVIEAQHKIDIKSPGAFLRKVTKNLALNKLEKKDYRLTDTIGDLLPDSVLLKTSTLEDQFESRQKLELFCRAVRQLPLKCRRVFILRRVYGFSQKEIAEYMDISLKTVEAHLAKAMVRSKEYMDTDEKRNSERAFNKANES